MELHVVVQSRGGVLVALDERGHLCWSEVRRTRETAVELGGEGRRGEGRGRGGGGGEGRGREEGEEERGEEGKERGERFSYLILISTCSVYVYMPSGTNKPNM